MNAVPHTARLSTEQGHGEATHTAARCPAGCSLPSPQTQQDLVSSPSSSSTSVEMGTADRHTDTRTHRHTDTQTPTHSQAPAQPHTTASRPSNAFANLPIQMLPHLSGASKKVLIKSSYSYSLQNKELSVFIPVKATSSYIPPLQASTARVLWPLRHAHGVQAKQPGPVMI